MNTVSSRCPKCGSRAYTYLNGCKEYGYNEYLLAQQHADASQNINFDRIDPIPTQAPTEPLGFADTSQYSRENRKEYGSLFGEHIREVIDIFKNW